MTERQNPDDHGKLALIDETNLRAMEAWHLRATQGMTQQDIAKHMGVEMRQVRNYLDRARLLVPDQYKARLDTYFEEALCQLDHLLQVLSDRITTSKLAGRIDMDAVKEYRKTVESKRKLLGLDRDKQRIELTGEDGGSVKIEAVSDEIVQLAQKRRKVREIEVEAREAT